MMEPAAVHRSERHKHVYTVTESMEDTYFYNADGEMLVVPEIGGLRSFSELGVIDITPGEIAVLPRGVKFTVELTDDQAARGYICENYGAMFVSPVLTIVRAPFVRAG